MYISLHNHTNYSKFDAIPSPEDYAIAARDLNMPSLAITDHGTIEGIKDFQQSCLKYGVKPIIGCEYYFCNDIDMKDKHERLRHIVLLAKNNRGWDNLFKLNSIALNHFYCKPRIDFNAIARYHDGLTCMTGCTQGVVPQLILANRHDEAGDLIKRFLQIFGDDLYLEIMRHNGSQSQVKVNDFLIDYADKHGLQPVATNDSHFINKEDYDKLPLRCRGFSRHHYLVPPTEMIKLFEDIPAAVSNTRFIADKCENILLV